jgi:protein-S-isoprenylcysteine O-methyltransferase Ste14
MQTVFVWVALAASAAILARGVHRPLIGAWPAYAFAIPLAVRLCALLDTPRDPAAASTRDVILAFQGTASAAFIALMVVLFATREQARGPRASRAQAAVALTGSLILNVVSFLPVDQNTSTPAVLVSGAFLCCGTGFATWSLAVLGRCFGIFPEVRGLIRRGPYRWVRHPVYLGEIVAAAGILVVRPHALTAILVAVFVGLQCWRSVFEESALTAAFPVEYPAYRATVPRLVPGLRLGARARSTHPVVA